jgi:polysaccharide biosynthesis transport protein
MENDEIDLRAVFSMLRRRIWLIVISTTLALAVAVVYLAMVTPIYTASALIFVDPSTRTLLDDENRTTTRSSEDSRIDSEVEILRSPTIALRVVERQNLVTDAEFGPSLGLTSKILLSMGIATAQTPSGERLVQAVLNRFSDAVSVNRLRGTHLIRVSVESESAERAAELANALAETYIDAQLESKVEGSLRGRDTLRAQIGQAQDSLTAYEQEIDLFIDRNLERIEAETGRRDIAEIREMLSALSDDRLTTETRLAESRRALELGDWATASQRLGDDALAELQRQREVLERRLSGTPAGSPEEIAAAAQYLANLEQEQSRIAEDVLERLRAEAGELANSVRETRSQLRDTVLSGELPPQMLSEFYELQQEASIARTQYQTMLSRMRELEIQAAIQMPDSRLVSPALPPRLPSFPNKRMVLALALFLGLFAGTGAAVLNEYIVGGVTSEDQLRDLLKARSVTTAPLVAFHPEKERSVADKLVSSPLSGYSEAIRQLRASLELSLRRKAAHRPPDAKAQGHCIVITSPIPAEGKTTVALGLGRAFATAGNSVLVIDGDLRLPALHEQAGTPTEVGLIDYLSNPDKQQLNERILAQDVLSSAFILPGRGHAIQETDHLLASSAFADLITIAKEAFEIVIIDTPPFLPVVDARYVVPFADAVVMVVRYASTTQSDVRRAGQALAEVMPPDSEFVALLNHQPERHSGYRYSAYYRS